MIKTTYKAFIGITRGKAYNNKFSGKIVKVNFAVEPEGIVEKILAFIGIHLRCREIYFWCPLKAVLSEGDYGLIGKKSRGKYSNVWFELTNTSGVPLSILKNLITLSAIDKLSPIRVTNKKMKEYLDGYLLEQ